MRNEDNDCIRYLMKEMDPSEELLMERAMMEDEDLLIEVESMRQTLHKLDKLPEVKPPSEVTNAVLEKAAQHARKNKKNTSKGFQPAVKYAVAATIALTITAGGSWLYMGTESSEPRSTIAQQNASNPSAAKVSGNSTSFQFTNTESQASSDQAVDPWVDRNDILRFEDQFSNRNNQFEAILKSSTQKLQLIENRVTDPKRINSLQLTGSSN